MQSDEHQSFQADAESVYAFLGTFFRGLVVGGLSGLMLGSFIYAIGASSGENFWILPPLFAVVFAFFVGARFHQTFKDNFRK